MKRAISVTVGGLLLGVASSVVGVTPASASAALPTPVVTWGIGPTPQAATDAAYYEGVHQCRKLGLALVSHASLPPVPTVTGDWVTSGVGACN